MLPNYVSMKGNAFSFNRNNWYTYFNISTFYIVNSGSFAST